MFLAKVLQLLAACTLALFALSANARAMDDLQAQKMPLEKIQLLPLDGPPAQRAKALDSPEEFACSYAALVSGATHQYFDEESNLSYNYFRSYQPTQGRYTQSDTIGLAGGLNRFAYVEGNSLSFVDPTGEIAIAPLIVWGLPIIVGGAWWYNTDKRPRWPDRPNDDGKPDGEPWPKDNKSSCIRTYSNCVNYGWKGTCQACLDLCKASGTGDWPFHKCSPKKKGDMCEAE